MKRQKQTELGLKQLNTLSRIANQRQDDGSIRIFTDSIVDTFAPPGVASDVLKDRLFALERQHRITNDVGITESSLSRGINAFLGRIGAPGFAQTNAMQLRLFRASLQRMGLPDVVASAADSAHADAIDRIPAEIGPAEATVLIGIILHNKLSSADMQIPPDEWSKRVMAKREQIESAKSNPITPSTHTLRGLQPTPEATALQDCLRTFAQSLESPDSLHQELERFIDESRNE